MTTKSSLPSQRRFAPDVLPWLVAVAALVIYFTTLNHWLTLNSISLAAKVAGWDWQPMAVQPALFLITLPCRWLPASWVPLALNAGTAVCAALTLALLARSVSLLPHDRVDAEQRLADNEHSLLLQRDAWVPPVLATLACGLQMTFWENAISATGEMLDLFFFAYIVRCLLEYRLEKKRSWLDRAALVWGVAVANNWGMVCFFPFLGIVLIGTRLLKFFKQQSLENNPIWTELFKFIQPYFLFRLGLLGLAGLSLFLLLPLVQALSPESPLSFWQALRTQAGFFKSGIQLVYDQFFKYHRDVGVLLALTSLSPVLVMSIRWRTFSTDDRTAFGLSVLIFLISHAALFLFCLWAAFDPFFSPRQITRQLGLPLPFLTLSYLPSLSIGYFSGFFLLMFRTTPGQPLQRWSLQQALQWTLPKLVYLLTTLAAMGLVYKNLPVIQTMNRPHLRHYGELTAQSLPPEGGIVLSENPFRLRLLQAVLASESTPDRYVTVDMQSLPSPLYQKYLRRKYPQRWPEPTAQNPSRSSSIGQPKTNATEILEEQVQRGIHLSQTNQLCCLHPAYGTLFELFYLEPRGLVYEMRRYPTNALSTPPLLPKALTNNEAFWNRTIETAVDPLLALIAGFEHPKRGLRKELMDSAHLEMPVPLQLKVVARWYAAALNSWGVTLQRHGQLREASRYFERAQDLNADNLTARVNFQCNTNLLAGRKLTVVQSASFDELSRRRLTLNQLVAEDGPVDDPSFCFRLGLVFAENRLFRQSGLQFDRVATLAPAAEKEMAFLAAGAWFNALRTTHQQLKVNPDDTSALLKEGIILIRLGACSNAIPPLTRVLALTNSPVALLSRANAYLSISNLDAAQTDYLKLQPAWPKDCRVYYGLGEIAYRRKDTNAAIGYYRDYLANAGAGTEEAKFIAARLQALRHGSP